MIEKEPRVIGEIETTNFELLRLIKSGGDLNSKGIGNKGDSIFSVRVIEGKWEKRLPSGQLMKHLIVQIITNGINLPTPRRDVSVQKVTTPRAKPKPATKLEVVKEVKSSNLFELGD